MLPYLTRTKGIGGAYLTTEDFVVKEIAAQKFLKRFTRTKNGVIKDAGPHQLFLLKKEGYTTNEARDRIARYIGISKDRIGIAGRKDKRAITTQYITVKQSPVTNLELPGITLQFIKNCTNKISAGDLEENEFEITLHNTTHQERMEKLIKEIKQSGIPNYFGPQRFGVRKNNHILGEKLLQKKFSEIKTLFSGTDIRKIPKETLKFYVQAYQSHMFNQTLAYYVQKKDMTIKTIPLVGYTTKHFGKARKQLMEHMNKDRIKTEYFQIPELAMTVKGSIRDAFIQPKELRAEQSEQTVKLYFRLPKGSYATVLIREITKNKELG